MTRNDRQIVEYMQDIRRKIHHHPEMGFQEVETAGLIRSELEKMGIEYRTFRGTGTIGLIKGAKPGI